MHNLEDSPTDDEHPAGRSLIVLKALFVISKLTSACYNTGKNLEFFYSLTSNCILHLGKHLAFHNVMIGIFQEL